MPISKYHWTALCAGMIWLSGCADILDIADKPVLTPSGPWRCLGSPPQANMEAHEMATVRVQACNFVSSNCSAAVTGLTAALCNKRDVRCATPIQTGIHDVGGSFTFEVPTGGTLSSGFDGYLQLVAPRELCTNQAYFGPSEAMACALLAPECDRNAPDERCKVPTFANALLFFNPPIRMDPPTPIMVPLVPAVASVSLVQAGGSKPIDPGAGSVFVTIRDCDGQPAVGTSIRVQSQSATATLYLVNGVPTATATETDASGIVGVLGLEPGFVQIAGYATQEPGNPVIGEVGVQVEPLTMSYVSLVPSR